MDSLDANTVGPVVSGVTPLDISIGLLLIISAVLAYARGVVQEGLSIAGWVGAIFATIYGFSYLNPFVRELTKINIVADFATGIAIFLTSLVILSLGTRRISKIVKSSALSAIDRSLGFLFGLARGALIVVVAYIGIRTIYPENNQPKWISESRSLALIKPGAELVVSLIPENLSAITNSNKFDSNGSIKKNSGKVIKDLMLPRPKDTDKQNTITGGYGRKERQQMERLHDSIQNK